MAGVMSHTERERVEFEKVMAAHVARLMGFARPFVGRLAPVDATDLIERALEAAWAKRGSFNPHKASLLIWWEECLREAARSRPRWCLRHSSGVEWVRSDQLGVR